MLCYNVGITLRAGPPVGSCVRRRKAFQVAAARTLGLANLVFSRQTVFFFECEHPFIDKLMVTTEPTYQAQGY